VARKKCVLWMDYGKGECRAGENMFLGENMCPQ
jgi:hypothetical protein